MSGGYPVEAANHMSDPDGSPEHSTGSDYESFGEQVRDALRHLYDSGYLDEHPLTSLFCSPTLQPSLRGRVVRTRLLDAIEALRPPHGTPAAAPAWRPYQLLKARYIDSCSTREAMQRVGLSHSQYHEEHRQALAGLTRRLWEDRGAATGGPRRWSRDALLRKEVSQVSAVEPLDLAQLSALIDHVLDMFKPIAASKQVWITYQACPEEKDIRVCTSQVILRQLLVQIVGSLVRASTESTIAARLLMAEGGAQIVLHSSTPEVEPQRVIDPPTRELAGALGIDLVVGQSAAGGVEISFTLPSRRGNVLLLIDNDQDLPELFRRYLVGQGWSLVAAQDAAEGLQLARQTRPDAVLLDIIMPDRDGWDVLAAFRDDPALRSTPVIICSVLPQPELALMLGASMFLPKPVDQLSLLQALERLAHRPPPY